MNISYKILIISVSIIVILPYRESFRIRFYFRIFAFDYHGNQFSVLMKRILLSAVLMLAMGIVLQAQQDQSRNIFIGVAPVASGNIDANLDGTICRLNYKPMYGASVGREILGNGRGVLFEAYYSRGKYDNLTVVEGDATGLSIPETDASMLGANGYWVYTINANKRLQLPLYGGIGLGFVHNASFSGLNFNLGAKARVKFYFLDGFGIFAGVAAQYGAGFKKDTGALYMSADAGILIAL